MTSIYFVLNGLVNGERGVRAIPAGGGDDPPQPDGWYYLPEGEVDGTGPLPSRQDAEEAARRVVSAAEPGEFGDGVRARPAEGPGEGETPPAGPAPSPWWAAALRGPPSALPGSPEHHRASAARAAARRRETLSNPLRRRRSRSRE